MMKSKEIKVFVEEGWIHTRILFQLVGYPKEHVEKTLKDYVITIGTEETIKIIKEDYTPAEKQDKVYSSLAEVDMLVKDFETMTKICFDYMPASIEIMDPKELTFKRKDIKNWTNDLIAKLHEVAIISKELRMQNEAVIRNSTTLVRNAVLFAAKKGMTLREIAAALGLTQNNVKPFADTLIKEGKIKIQNDKLSEAHGNAKK